MIQKKWGNQWYQLLDDSYVNENAVNPDGFQELDWQQNLNWSLMPGYQNWELVSNLWRDQSGNVTESPLYQEDYSTGFKQKEKWENFKWNGREILSFDPKDHRLYSVSRLNGSESPIIQKEKYLDSGLPKLDGTHLSQAKALEEKNPFGENLSDRESLNILTRIENPRFIWMWKDGKNQLKEVELPRFGVHFLYSNNNQQLKSPELENYFLSNEQTHPSFGNNPHYLIIQNHKNQKRLFVPRFKFEPLEKEESLQVHYQLNWFERPAEIAQEYDEPIYFYGRKSQKFFVWSIDSFSNTLELPQQEDRFFYSMVQLWERSVDLNSYEKSRELLYGSRSELGDLRLKPEHKMSGAREVLEWISRLGHQDHDPRAIALELGAGLMVLENELANQRLKTIEITRNNQQIQILVPESFADESFRNRLKKQFLLYLGVREKISTRWLPEDLEIIFIKLILQDSEDREKKRFDNRLSELTGKPNGHQISSQLGHETEYPNNWYSYWDESMFMTHLIDGKQCENKTDLFHGFGVSASDLYSLALNLKDNSVNIFLDRGRNQLERILGVNPNFLAGLSREDLKEEYLGVLRIMLRQSDLPNREGKEKSSLSPKCRSFVASIYALMNCSGDLKEIRNKYSSYESLVTQINSRPHWSSSDYQYETNDLLMVG